MTNTLATQGYSFVGDTGIEPVTSSVSGINTVLSTPPLSTRTIRGPPLMSPHIRGRCHAISQSPNHPHISGRPRTSAGLLVGRPPVLCHTKTGPKGWKKPRPRPDCRLRLRPVDPRSLEVQSFGSNRHGPEASHRRTARHISPC